MGDSTDRRASERMAVNTETDCAFAGLIADDFGPAKIRDVSLEGIGLIFVRRAEVGALLVIGLANQTRGFAKTVIVRVAHVTAIHGGFLVGGEFVEPLTYQEFTALVM